MKKRSTVFLCGDQSPYGLAHVSSIIENFDVKAIVIADNNRWRLFRKVLSGGENSQIKAPEAINIFIKKIVNFLKRKKSPLDALKTYNLPIIKVHDINSTESIEVLLKNNPELLLSAAYPQILSKELINSFPNGAINFHPSLLPKCRGAHPHYWCIATGEKQSGITAHFMTENIDDGDIVVQHFFDIEGLYYDELYRKIINKTPDLVEEVAHFLETPDAKPIPQDERKVTVFRNDREIHRKLDFCHTNSVELFNKIRAGRSYFFYQGIKTYVIESNIAQHNRHMTNDIKVVAGTIVDIGDNGVIIYTRDNNFIVLKRLRWRKKVVQFSIWVNKFNISIGERLV